MSSEIKKQEVESSLEQSVHSSLSGNSEMKHEDGTQEFGSDRRVAAARGPRPPSPPIDD